MSFDSGSRIEPWVDYPKTEITEMQDPATPVAREEQVWPKQIPTSRKVAVWLDFAAHLSHFAHVRMPNVQTLATPKSRSGCHFHKVCR